MLNIGAKVRYIVKVELFKNKVPFEVKILGIATTYIQTSSVRRTARI